MDVVHILRFPSTRMYIQSLGASKIVGLVYLYLGTLIHTYSYDIYPKNELFILECFRQLGEIYIPVPNFLFHSKHDTNYTISIVVVDVIVNL